MSEEEVVERLRGQLFHRQDFDDLVDADGFLHGPATNVVEASVDDVIGAAKLREEDGVSPGDGPNESDFFEVLAEQNQESDQLSSQKRESGDDQVIASLQASDAVQERVQQPEEVDRIRNLVQEVALGRGDAQDVTRGPDVRVKAGDLFEQFVTDGLLVSEGEETPRTAEHPEIGAHKSLLSWLSFSPSREKKSFTTATL